MFGDAYSSGNQSLVADIHAFARWRGASLVAVTLRPGKFSMSATPITFINVFSVDPADQAELVRILTQVTEGIVRHKAGFISARLHRSFDGKKVTMYAQWQSLSLIHI